jgi:4-hydroxy-4-methyl-2-oxoglutarate aldolase
MRIAELGYPFFCRGSIGGTAKDSWGKLNVAVQCGGVVVHPGDYVIGDVDGVVVVAQADIHRVLQKAKAIAQRETEVKELLRQGKSTLEIYGFDALIQAKGFREEARQ